MFKCITIHHSESKDLTRIKFTDSFANADGAFRADVLRDAIHELTKIYEETVQGWFEGGKHE